MDRAFFIPEPMSSTTNPFSPNYVSQLKPGPRIPFKLPKLDQPPRKDSLVDPNATSTSAEGKKYRLLKARI